MNTEASPAVPQPAQEQAAPGVGDFDIGPMMERFTAQENAAKQAAVAEPVKTEEVAQKNTEEAALEAKTEEKAAESNEVPDDFPSKKHATPEAINTWKGMKEELSKLRTELGELKDKQLPAKDQELQAKLLEIEESKKRLAEFEGKDISQYEKRIKELEERDAENEKFRAVHDVMNSRTFHNEIIAPAEKIGAAVEELAKSYELSPDTIKEALKTEDPVELRRKLRELTSDWNPMDAAELASYAKTHRELSDKAQQMIDNAEKAKQELRYIEETESKKKSEAQLAAEKAAYEAVDKQLVEKFAILKDDPELAETLKNAKFEDTPANRALAAKTAPMVMKLNDLYHKAQSEIKALKEELSKRNAAKPNPSQTTQPAKEIEDRTKEQRGYTPEDAMNRWFEMQTQGA